MTRFQQNKLLSAQKISSRQVSNYFQIDKILFLTRCKANYFWHKRQAPDKFQIIYKISNWIPDKIQSRLLSAPKKSFGQISRFSDFTVQDSKLLFKVTETTVQMPDSLFKPPKSLFIYLVLRPLSKCLNHCSNYPNYCSIA